MVTGGNVVVVELAGSDRNVVVVTSGNVVVTRGNVVVTGGNVVVTGGNVVVVELVVDTSAIETAGIDSVGGAVRTAGLPELTSVVVEMSDTGAVTETNVVDAAMSDANDSASAFGAA